MMPAVNDVDSVKGLPLNRKKLALVLYSIFYLIFSQSLLVGIHSEL